MFLLFTACTDAVVLDTAKDKHAPRTEPIEHVPGAQDTGTPPEPEVGLVFFEREEVLDFRLEVPPASWASLSADGRTYEPATFTADGESWTVGLRLKGNTTWQDISAKPALIVDMNHELEGQSYTGISSFYLHNMMYDPSMMHERLAFAWFRSFGVPASRTAYVRLTLNGEDYGYYLAVEKENDEYLDQWWEDDSGSVYEAGSFNWPCDVNYAPGGCFEEDRVGEGDSREALERLTIAAHAPDTTWVEVIEEVVDLDAFLRAMAADVLVSHYDDYGWNINNYRIYHDPSSDRWYWTPWSTDLAFGWYPWMDGPHCGTYGQTISEYGTGYLLGRCMTIAACNDRWHTALGEAADAFEAFGLPGQIAALHEQTAAQAASDTRRSYGDAALEAEVACMATWAAQRPAQIRAELAAY